MSRSRRVTRGSARCGSAKWPPTTRLRSATAIGHRAPGLALRVGPLALGVRSPVSLALGASSVASLTGSRVDIALGASSPAIVAGWHDRQWAHHVEVMRETIECVRSILTGARIDCSGRHVRSHGFRLRSPVPETRIAVGAFGPAVTRVAAQHADEVVLNLVPPTRVAEMRGAVDAGAAAASRAAPRRAALDGVGAGRALPKGCRANATGRPASRVSRPTRLWRNVQRVGVWRPGCARPCWHPPPRARDRGSH